MQAERTDNEAGQTDTEAVGEVMFDLDRACRYLASALI